MGVFRTFSLVIVFLFSLVSPSGAADNVQKDLEKELRGLDQVHHVELRSGREASFEKTHYSVIVYVTVDPSPQVLADQGAFQKDLLARLRKVIDPRRLESGLVVLEDGSGKALARIPLVEKKP